MNGLIANSDSFHWETHSFLNERGLALMMGVKLYMFQLDTNYGCTNDLIFSPRLRSLCCIHQFLSMCLQSLFYYLLDVAILLHRHLILVHPFSSHCDVFRTCIQAIGRSNDSCLTDWQVCSDSDLLVHQRIVLLAYPKKPVPLVSFFSYDFRKEFVITIFF